MTVKPLIASFCLFAVGAQAQTQAPDCAALAAKAIQSARAAKRQTELIAGDIEEATSFECR